MSALRRPRFLFDVAEELTWLKDHAGVEVAERWYEALWSTIQFMGKTHMLAVNEKIWRRQAFGRGECVVFLDG